MTVTVVVRQGVMHWLHLLILLGVLAVIPLLTFIANWAFEAKRWSQSDNAPSWLRSGDD